MSLDESLVLDEDEIFQLTENISQLLSQNQEMRDRLKQAEFELRFVEFQTSILIYKNFNLLKLIAPKMTCCLIRV